MHFARKCVKQKTISSLSFELAWKGALIDINCAIREFEEETGYSSENLIILKNVGFIEEIFTGSNAKSYKHKYYICKMDYKKTLCENNFQKEEIGDLKWFSYSECIVKIRDYNHEKVNILKRVHSLINNNLYI